MGINLADYYSKGTAKLSDERIEELVAEYVMEHFKQESVFDFSFSSFLHESYKYSSNEESQVSDMITKPYSSQTFPFSHQTNDFKMVA